MLIKEKQLNKIQLKKRNFNAPEDLTVNINNGI
jgi:hypothetical protein